MLLSYVFVPLPFFFFNAAWLRLHQTLHPIQQFEPEQPSEPQLPPPQSAYSGWFGTHPGWLRVKKLLTSTETPLHFIILFLPFPSTHLGLDTKCQDSVSSSVHYCPNVMDNKNAPSSWMLGRKISPEWSWETVSQSESQGISMKIWAPAVSGQRKCVRSAPYWSVCGSIASRV